MCSVILDLISILMGIFFQYFGQALFNSQDHYFPIQPFHGTCHSLWHFGSDCQWVLHVPSANLFRLTRKQLYGVLIFWRVPKRHLPVCQLCRDAVDRRFSSSNHWRLLFPLQVAFLSLWIFRENLGWVGNFRFDFWGL